MRYNQKLENSVCALCFTIDFLNLFQKENAKAKINQRELKYIEEKKTERITATTTDLGNRFNGKMVLYLEDLANPK
ncbi:MAG TPA: hypothetical protein VF465_13265, partial [Flavobacterium sp.]|uniref:hypothetical protein n=1 Tax=Flavobacterium sp. TaxID=239 RepID=UPI002ED6B717